LYDGTPYAFVDGAVEMEDVEVDGERIIFSESSWKKAYQCIENAFPKRTVQGWFLCGGPGSQLSPLNYWKQHGQYFAGKNQLMYLNHGIDGEEAIYITSEDGFYRLKGHCIYYERNQMMQDYMVTRKDVRRVETGSHEKVVKDFRQRMTARKEQAESGHKAVGALGMLCGALAVAVLAGGVAYFNNYNRLRQMESVLVSVLPAGTADWTDYQKQKSEEPDFIIEEVSGDILPTKKGVEETGESYGSTEENKEDAEEAQTEPAEDGGAISESGDMEPETAEETAGENVPPETLAPQPSGTEKEAAAATGFRIYEVGDGETLYGICFRVYGNLKRREEICRLNALDDENRILAGQKLILPE
jgi:tetrahydromethanopterin S-methyltransferase subunit F